MTHDVCAQALCNLANQLLSPKLLMSIFSPFFAFRLYNDELDHGSMSIQKAIQLLCSTNEKYQAMGAYYLQHTCFQDESAKQEVKLFFTMMGQLCVALGFRCLNVSRGVHLL